jgi:DNA recombination protein RmuC
VVNLAALGGSLGELESRLDRRLGDLDAKVDRKLDGLDTRLLTTQRDAGASATQMAVKLARVEESTKSMLERANDLKRLEQALRPPKARGGFGELLLANLLADMLPSSAYALQHGFASGERVDAVIRAEKLLPVDAKFPLDNLHRVLDAEDDDQRLIARRALARDVKGHVDAIATKYVKPGEGTYDFAFMYLPAETVYYEIACGGSGDLQQYALSRRVFPVSPATFHAYLTMIVIGLRGLQIEKHAQDVMAYCGQLAKDFGRFRDDFDVVGKHIGNAQGKYGEAQRRLERFETRLEQAVDEDALEQRAAGLEVGEQLRAIDAA